MTTLSLIQDYDDIYITEPNVFNFHHCTTKNKSNRENSTSRGREKIERTTFYVSTILHRTRIARTKYVSSFQITHLAYNRH